MATAPQPDQALAALMASLQGMREFSVRLFSRDAGPPYSHALSQLSDLASLLEIIASEARTTQIPELPEACALLQHRVEALATAPGLSDEEALQIAEQFDHLTYLAQDLELSFAKARASAPMHTNLDASPTPPSPEHASTPTSSDLPDWTDPNLPPPTPPAWMSSDEEALLNELEANAMKASQDPCDTEPAGPDAPEPMPEPAPEPTPELAGITPHPSPIDPDVSDQPASSEPTPELPEPSDPASCPTPQLEALPAKPGDLAGSLETPNTEIDTTPAPETPSAPIDLGPAQALPPEAPTLVALDIAAADPEASQPSDPAPDISAPVQATPPTPLAADAPPETASRSDATSASSGGTVASRDSIFSVLELDSDAGFKASLTSTEPAPLAQIEAAAQTGPPAATQTDESLSDPPPMAPASAGVTEAAPEWLAQVPGMTLEMLLATRPLSLGPAQADLREHFAKELHAAATQLDAIVDDLQRLGPGAIWGQLVSLGASLDATSRFFGFAALSKLSELLAATGQAVAGAHPSLAPTLASPLKIIRELLARFGTGLGTSVEHTWDLNAFATATLASLSPRAGQTSQSPEPAADSQPTPPVAQSPGDAPAELSAEEMLMLLAAEQQASTWGTVPLALPPEKAELLQFMVNDVKQAAEQVASLAPRVGDLATLDDVAGELIRLCETMERATREFEFRSLNSLISLLADVGYGLRGVAEPMVGELRIRVLAIQSLILQHAGALEVGMETTWPLQTITARVHRILAGQSLAPQIIGWHKNDVEKATELDGVAEGVEPPPVVSDADDQSNWYRPRLDAAQLNASAGDIVRVDGAVIDHLQSAVGVMAQHRARVQLIADELRAQYPHNARIDELCRSTELLERSMVTVQTGIMGTRLQPLSKLFDNYPRVVRDVARLADREAELTSSGGTTLVDKSIVEGLAEPLMTVLRFVASKLIENPDARRQASKTPQGNLRLSANHQGSQVVISLEDDGAGFDRADAIAQITSSGLLSQEQAEARPDNELATLLFEDDISTSPLCKVTSLLRDTVGGSLFVHSTPGKGCRIDIIVPMRSTILPSVIVAVGASFYTVPLQAVLEITKIQPELVKSVGGSPCIRLRDQILPLLDARRLFDEPGEAPPTFALIITTGQAQAALCVDRVVSKTDMIINQIDDARLRKGPFSGTTLTPSGVVSLVIDVQRVIASQSSPQKGVLAEV